MLCDRINVSCDASRPNALGRVDSRLENSRHHLKKMHFGMTLNYKIKIIRLTFIVFPCCLFRRRCQAPGHLDFTAPALWYQLFRKRSKRTKRLVWWFSLHAPSLVLRADFEGRRPLSQPLLKRYANEGWPPTRPRRIWRIVFRSGDSQSGSSNGSWTNIKYDFDTKSWEFTITSPTSSWRQNTAFRWFEASAQWCLYELKYIQ